ncbi:MAG: lamin tail domain-containing protein [Candidatus Liptonbacteria bacterium]|nr:lamin tail domain-containing protein [Candidatus Liptonbacteria bacterium]
MKRLGARNKISLFALFIAPITVGAFVSANEALAYGVGTHAYLTSEIFDFYNERYQNNKISENLKPFLIDGSRREDDAPRWLNHFYDPINDTGLTSIYGDGYRSKEWAEDAEKQTETRYKAYAFITSILTAWQEKQLGALTTESDFTWERAVEYYARGDKEKAMFILGHVLHLLEDASVPDHTRNDPHPGSEWDRSPYENFAGAFGLESPDKELKTRLTGMAPIVQDSVDNYFNVMAKYSNNNFYSQNRIGVSSGYELPIPSSNSPTKISGRVFAVKEDEEGNTQLLFMYARYGDLVTVLRSDITLSDPDSLVLKNYWSLLSTSAVRHGAGLIDLFFKEVAAAEKDGRYNNEAEKSFFANTIDAVIGWWDSLFGDNGGGSVTESANLIEVIPLNNDVSDTSNDYEELGTSVSVTILPKTQTGEVAGASDEESQYGEVTPPAEELPPGDRTSTCSYGVPGTPSRAGIIINEVAWMGTTNSANDEWIELKNISGTPVDASGWQVIDKEEQIHITIDSGTKLEAGKFLLLERADDDTVPGIAADFIYSGALANTGEGLRLFDNKCGLMDEVIAASSWPAGNNSTKNTMERIYGFGWQSSSVTNGTPKAENSTYPSGGSGGGASASPPPSSTQADDNTANASSATDTSNMSDTTNMTTNHIVISEIQAGATNASDYEFIELYNPTETAVDLTGWELRKKTSSGSESNLVDDGVFAGTILPKRFFLIASPSYNGNVEPDLRYSAQSASIAYTNNSILLYNGDHATAEVVDDITYGEIEAGKSLERKAFKNSSCVLPQNENEFLGNGCDADSNNDFEAREIPKPQNSTSLPEPRDAPAAVNDLEVSFSTSSLALIFNWRGSPSTSSGTIESSSVANYFTYEVKEYNSSGVSIYNGTSTAFERRIDEVGRGYRFSIQAADKDGLASDEVFKDFEVPGILSGIYFYQAPTSSIFGNAPVVELRYNNYPFLPDLTSRDHGANWKVLVFYKNKEAPKDEFLDSARPTPENLSDALFTEYESCVGILSYKSSLLLPDDESQCGIWGGFMNDALRFGKYLAGTLNRLIFRIGNYGDADFGADGYLTVAYYGFYRSYPQGTRVEDGALNNFKLLTVDKTKYFFNGNPPEHLAPELSGEINVEYAKSGSINLNWSDAQDPDTEPNLVKYEVNFSTSSESNSAHADFLDQDWQNLGHATTTSRVVLPGERFLIGVRARDDFGNYSNILTKEWSRPPIRFLIEQLNQDGWSYPWGRININCSVCGGGLIDSASLQSISSGEEGSFNKVLLDIQRNNGGDDASYRLAVYDDNGANKPDFSNKIAETESGNSVFYFADPVTVEANQTYWFVLDARYDNPVGYYRTSFQNAISTAGDFEDGVAASGPSGECNGSYCPSFRIPYPTASADWFMRVGLEE